MGDETGTPVEEVDEEVAVTIEEVPADDETGTDGDDSTPPEERPDELNPEE